MKKTLLVILLILGLLITMIPPIFAQEVPGPSTGLSGETETGGTVEVGSAASVSAEAEAELSAEPGLLPTSPFYFLKEWGRGVRSAFTFNAVSKAEYELKVAGQKAAELKKVERVSPQNVEAVKRAVENYNKNITKLKVRLESLSETSNNPKVDDLLNRVTSRAIKHQEVFEELKQKHEELKPVVESAQVAIDAAVGTLPEKFDDAEKFKKRLEDAIGVGEDESIDPIRGLKAAVILDRLEGKLPEDGFSKNIVELKGDLLLKFEGAVRSGEILPEKIEQRLQEIPGGAPAMLKVIDDIRESATDSRLKNTLNALRPQVIRDVEIKDAIDQEDAERAIGHAKELIEKVSTMISSGEYENGKNISALIEKAKFNLADAETLLKNSQYGAAFGQANSAGSIAKAAMNQLHKKGEGLEKELAELKARFDKLVKHIGEKGFTRESNPKIFALIDSVEKQILNAKDRTAIVSIKRMLSEIEGLIRKESSSNDSSSLSLSGRVEVSGYVIGLETNTSLSLDASATAPRFNRFKAKLEGGEIITVAYSVSLPSILERSAKPELSIDGGIIKEGAYFKAKGIFKKEENTLYIEGKEDALKTIKSGASRE